MKEQGPGLFTLQLGEFVAYITALEVRSAAENLKAQLSRGECEWLLLQEAWNDCGGTDKHSLIQGFSMQGHETLGMFCERIRQFELGKQKGFRDVPLILCRGRGPIDMPSWNAEKKRGAVFTGEVLQRMAAAKVGGGNPRSRKVWVEYADSERVVFGSGSEAARALGLSQQYFSLWVSGKRVPPGYRGSGITVGYA